MKKIGLYFGSFNPIHIGHLVIANYFAEFSELDEVWFVVTPQNPLKKKESLLGNDHRYRLVSEAIEGYQKFKVSNIEFNLPQPSYTVNSLAYIKEKHPNLQFGLILGSDNLATFHKWKNNEEILKQYHLYVYPRPGYEAGELLSHEHVTMVNAPLMDISSSFIRKAIKEKKDVRYMLHERVYQYITEMHFYAK